MDESSRDPRDNEAAANPYSGPFDRLRTLEELLPAASRAKLIRCLSDLLDCPVRIEDGPRRAESAAPGAVDDSHRCAITLECEAIGFLVAPVEAARLSAAAMLVELIIQNANCYQMAAHLHAESTEEDFRKLTEKHHALQLSEANYRALAEQLEQRVAQQVKTIETAQRQLYLAEKLASVGQLAAGVAHEINNPIGFITSNLNSGLKYVERLVVFAGQIRTTQEPSAIQAHWQAADLDFLLEDFTQLLQESISGAARVARIVADLKGFSRVDAPTEGAADLNEIVRRVGAMAAAQFQEQATLELDLNPVPSLVCHADQLGQVILNILLNAVQALEKPGSVRISTALCDDAVEIRIQDSGPGIAPEVLPRIFDPFFTTKDVGRGTGLGLTVCHDIVKAHGGRIEVDSVVGIGTTFSVILPLLRSS